MYNCLYESRYVHHHLYICICMYRYTTILNACSSCLFIPANMYLLLGLIKSWHPEAIVILLLCSRSIASYVYTWLHTCTVCVYCGVLHVVFMYVRTYVLQVYGYIRNMCTEYRLYVLHVLCILLYILCTVCAT